MDTELRGNISTGILAPAGVTRAAGGLIYALDTHRYCWQLRSTEEKWSGTWGLWGGRSNPKESPRDTLLRECQEETGITEWKKIVPLHRYVSKDKKFIYDTFCLVVEKEFLPVLDHESDGYCWLPLGIQPKPLHHKSKQLVQNSSFMSKLVNMEKWLDQHVDD
jgi:8-oxo-dGTP pyrophosphatase MutT (NUDIX family)